MTKQIAFVPVAFACSMTSANAIAGTTQRSRLAPRSGKMTGTPTMAPKAHRRCQSSINPGDVRVLMSSKVATRL